MQHFRERAEALDAADPLAGFRARFAILNPDEVYLDGNSLGRAPHAGLERLESAARDAWAAGLVGSWKTGWYEAPLRVGDRLAPLVGAHAGEVAIADSTTVNLYKLAVAALRARPGRRRVVTDDLNFPSDLYALRSALDAAGGGELTVVPSQDGIHGSVEGLRAALGADTALLSLSHTAFKSGFVYPMDRLTAAAHAVGALTLWDLSHSVGALPVDLSGCGADLAVGCTYKYLNGGPGAPAFLFVRTDLQAQLENPIGGWFAQLEPFAFDLETKPTHDLRRFLVSTPPILSLSPIEAGIDLLLEAGMDRVRAKSVALTEFLIEMADAVLDPFGVIVASPRDPEQRGSHVSLRHPDAYAVCLALIEQESVVPDFRTPDNVRFGVTPLSTTFDELVRAVEGLARILEGETYHRGGRPSGVT